MIAQVKVKNAFEKIEYTKFRLNKLYKWDAPKKFEKLKMHCISILTDRVIFLEDHSMNNGQKYD